MGKKKLPKVGDKFKIYKKGPISVITGIEDDKINFETILSVNNNSLVITGSVPMDIYNEYRKIKDEKNLI